MELGMKPNIDFLALRKKNNIYLASFRVPSILLKKRKFCNWVKMPMFRAQKDQFLDFLQKCLSPQKTDIDPNFTKLY